MKMISFMLMLMSALPPAWGAPQKTENGEIREAVTAFVRAQTRIYPGKTDFSVSDIDPRLQLAACTSPEAFLPAGGRLLGNSTVGVRCQKTADGKNWSIYVPVRITVNVTLLVSNKPLPAGHIMTEADFDNQGGIMQQFDTLTDPGQVLGKVLTHSVGAGQTLRHDMLREPYSIRQGQTVQLQAAGNGFRIGYQGLALNNAADGQMLQIRLSSGHVISGVAHANSVVEIMQ